MAETFERVFLTDLPPNELSSIIVPPNGHVLYVGGSYGGIYAIDRSSGEVVHQTLGQGWFPEPMPFSNRGSVVVGRSGGHVHGIHAASGAPLWASFVGVAPPYMLSASADGSVLIAATGRNLMRIDPSTGATLEVTDVGYPISKIALSPDGLKVAVAEDEPYWWETTHLDVIAVQGFTPITRVSLAARVEGTMAFARDASALLVGIADKRIYRYRTDTWQLTHSQLFDTVDSGARFWLSPNGREIAVPKRDYFNSYVAFARVADLMTLNEYALPEPATAGAFTGSGKHFLFGTTQLFAVSTSDGRMTYRSRDPQTRDPLSISVSPDNARLVVARLDGCVIAMPNPLP